MDGSAEKGATHRAPQREPWYTKSSCHTSPTALSSTWEKAKQCLLITDHVAHVCLASGGRNSEETKLETGTNGVSSGMEGVPEFSDLDNAREVEKTKGVN